MYLEGAYLYIHSGSKLIMCVIDETTDYMLWRDLELLLLCW
jgi:hypothetical protein